MQRHILWFALSASLVFAACSDDPSEVVVENESTFDELRMDEAIMRGAIAPQARVVREMDAGEVDTWSFRLNEGASVTLQLHDGIEQVALLRRSSEGELLAVAESRPGAARVSAQLGAGTYVVAVQAPEESAGRCDLSFDCVGTGCAGARLYARLEALGGEHGLSFFTMPKSGDLGAIPQDPNNPLTEEKVELGQLLFHDPELLQNPRDTELGAGTGSCASCHHARAGFQAGIRQGIGEGGYGFGVYGEARERHPAYDAANIDVQPVRTPSAMNGAWQTNMLWNGQFGATGTNIGTEERWTAGMPVEVNHLGFEGLESQAIAGQDVHRLDVSTLVGDPLYTPLFVAAFPDSEPPINRENAGLAIAAYERTLLANQSPFQRWLRGDDEAMGPAEVRGAELFFGEAQCVSCHTGPALNDMNFYALGMGDLIGGDVIRSDVNDPAHQGRAQFTGDDADRYRFKTPQLYNLLDAPFYGHGGTFTSVREVVEYKNRARPERAFEAWRLAEGFRPLALSTAEVDALVDFLESALYDPDLLRYEPQDLPSGRCLINDDAGTRESLGCVD